MDHGFWDCKNTCIYCGRTDHYHRECPKARDEYPDVRDSGRGRQQAVLGRVERVVAQKRTLVDHLQMQTNALRVLSRAAEKGLVQPAGSGNDKAALRTLKVKEWREVLKPEVLADPTLFARTTLAMNQQVRALPPFFPQAALTLLQARGLKSLRDTSDGDLGNALVTRNLWPPDDFLWNEESGLLQVKEGRYVFDD